MTDRPIPASDETEESEQYFGFEPKKTIELWTTPASDETERIADEIGEHWIKHDVNLGQYKSELQCACGDKLIVDGHADDWHSSHTVTVNRHIASKIAAAVQAESRKLLERLHRTDGEGLPKRDYDNVTDEAIDTELARLDSEQQKLGGKS